MKVRILKGVIKYSQNHSLSTILRVTSKGKEGNTLRLKIFNITKSLIMTRIPFIVFKIKKNFKISNYRIQIKIYILN